MKKSLSAEPNLEELEEKGREMDDVIAQLEKQRIRLESRSTGDLVRRKLRSTSIQYPLLRAASGP